MNEIHAVVLEGKTIVDLARNYGNFYIRKENGEKVHSDGSNNYDYEMKPGDLFFQETKKSEITGYVAADKAKNIKQKLTVELYEKLPESLQELYNKETKVVIEETVFDGEVHIVNLESYVEQVPELIIYNSDMVANALCKMNFKSHKRAMVSSHTPYRESVHLYVDFFVNDYNGKTRKILERKRNGQPYADSRGRYVPDYPEVIERITIPSTFVPQLSATSQEEMDAKVQAYFDKITMAHLLEGK